MMDKLPPLEKIYEAYSALADERATLFTDHGEVFSSDRKKRYTVSFQDDTYSSNDNATYWQGYAGYPVIAILFLQGRLAYDRKTAMLFKDINWHELNKRYKRDYEAVVEAVMTERQLDKDKIRKETAAVYEELKQMDIRITRGKLRPPK